MPPLWLRMLIYAAFIAPGVWGAHHRGWDWLSSFFLVCFGAALMAAFFFWIERDD